MPGLSFMESRALSKRVTDGRIGEDCGRFWSATFTNKCRFRHCVGYSADQLSHNALVRGSGIRSRDNFSRARTANQLNINKQ